MNSSTKCLGNHVLLPLHCTVPLPDVEESVQWWKGSLAFLLTLMEPALERHTVCHKMC